MDTDNILDAIANSKVEVTKTHSSQSSYDRVISSHEISHPSYEYDNFYLTNFQVKIFAKIKTELKNNNYNPEFGDHIWYIMKLVSKVNTNEDKNIFMGNRLLDVGSRVRIISELYDTAYNSSEHDDEIHHQLKLLAKDQISEINDRYIHIERLIKSYGVVVRNQDG